MPASKDPGLQDQKTEKIEALTGSVVTGFDGGQRHVQRRPGGASISALKQPAGHKRAPLEAYLCSPAARTSGETNGAACRSHPLLGHARHLRAIEVFLTWPAA